MSGKWRTLALTLIRAIGSAVAAPFAYVPNEKSGTIAVIDTVEVGDLTWGVALHRIALASVVL